MTKKTIKTIVILMTFAMLSLISYQVYWIENAIRINDVQFRQNVHEALGRVVTRLEKNEVYHTAYQQFNNQVTSNRIYYQDSNWITRLNTLEKNARSMQFENPGDNQGWMTDIVLEDSVILGEQQIKIRYQFQNYFSPEFFDPASPLTNRKNPIFEQERNFDQEVQKSIQKIAQKSRMVTIVLDELMGNPPRIENRINQQQLENLLSEELKAMGITLDYEYAVVDKQNNHSLFANYVPEDKPDVLSSDFSIKLFPNDIAGKDHLLTIFFPKQTSFLIKQIWLIMTSSIFLVLLIIFLFAYAIQAILKQKKLSEIKNDFINNMTHEFKTPISTVSLACEALQDNEIKKNRDFMNNYIRIIQDENNRLRRQVDKVLQMATIDKKEYKLKMVDINIHDVIEKAISHINLQVEKRGGRIEKRLIADNYQIISDEIHLTNIIYNLLDNANKYSSQQPLINVETEDHHQGILIRIRDRGIGMSKDELNKIFEKFYRVPTGNLHDVKGFGLGLAYVKTMLTALGGQVKVQSTPGLGSTFEIILPLAPHGQN
jgi:two-component system, OmpR family, phosphate regulon sensor histidine kinase PhoR